MKSRNAIRWIFGIIFLLFLFILSCTRPTPSSLKDVTRTGFIPPELSSSNLKGLLLINFENNSDDNLPWGSYCSRVLLYKVGFAPNEIIYCPNIFWLIRDIADIQIPNPKDTSLPLDLEKYYAHAYGTDNILHGKIEKKGDTLTFQGFIFSMSKKTSIAEITQTGSLSDPSDFFNYLSLKIIDALKINLTAKQKNYILQKDTGNSEAFKLGLQAFCSPADDSTTAFSLYQQAVTKDNNFIFSYIGAQSRMTNYKSKDNSSFFGYIGAQSSATDNKSQNAINIIQQGAGRFRNNHGVKLEYIHALQSVEKYDDAIRESQELLQYNPHNLQAWTSLAWSYYSKKEYAKALDAEGYAMKYYPNCWITHNDYSLIALAWAQNARGGNYYGKMSENNKKIFDKNVVIAYDEIKLAEKLHPRSSLVLCNLIQASIENPVETKEVENTFDRATAINPHNIDLYTVMSWLYAPGYNDQPEKRRKLLSEGIRLNPDNPQFAMMVLQNLGWYRYVKEANPEQNVFSRDTNTLEKAKQIILKYAANHPKDQKLIFDVTENLYDAKMYKDAWPFYEKLPDPPDIRVDLIHAYYNHKGYVADVVGKPDLALKYADKCLASNPCNVCGPQACILKGTILMWKKQFKEGFDLMQEAINRNPGMDYSYSEYANWAAYYNYNVDQGFTYIKKAIKMNPDNANNIDILARLYLSKKDKQNALVFINKAIEMDSSDKSFLKDKKKILALH